MAIRSVNFRDDVIFSIAFSLGLDPRRDLVTDQVNAFVSYINRWVRRLCDKMDWPEWTVIEQRTPDVNHYVDFDQSLQTPIGRVFKVYLADPDLNRGPLDTPFKLSSKGIHVGFDHGSTVFIKFGKRAPSFTIIPYAGATTYAKDAVVFDPASGNCYVSLQAANTGNALTNAAFWALQPFPFVIADAVVRGAYSECLRDMGQADKAAVEEQGAGALAGERAGAVLADANDQLTDQQQSIPRYRIVPGPSPVAGTDLLTAPSPKQ